MPIKGAVAAALLYCGAAFMFYLAVSTAWDLAGGPLSAEAVEKETIAVRARLGEATGREYRASFSPGWKGSSDLVLRFPAATADVDSNALINRGMKIPDASGKTLAPSFDFDWQILERGTAIAGGSGRSGNTGNIAFFDKTRGLIFGQIPLEPGRTYDVRMTMGPNSAAFLRAAPVLEIHAPSSVSSSVHFRRGRDRLTTGVLAFVFASLGLWLAVLGWRRTRPSNAQQ